MHATVALEEGVDILFCLNPLVPFDATKPTSLRAGASSASIPSVVKGGLPAVMSQTFRSLIHSRLELGMKQYERSYPKTAIVLIEPDHRDADMFLANTFSYRQRRELAEHAYQSTRQFLRRHFLTLNTRLKHHGVLLNRHVLFDVKRQLLESAQTRHLLKFPHRMQRLNQAIDRLQDSVDDLDHALQQGVLMRR
jgi:hypothetical protein